jgi:hypothetical protein
VGFHFCGGVCNGPHTPPRGSAEVLCGVQVTFEIELELGGH